MREIKFRYVFRDKHTRKVIKKIFSLEFLESFNMDIYLLENSNLKLIGKNQYTGLKDKNGVEIYDSDIVRLNFPFTKTNAEVIFNDGQFYPNSRCETIYCRRWNEDCLVVGDKYENPELLEVKND